MTQRFQRRAAIGALLATAAALPANSVQAQKRPNIIYIFTDQQSATMMSCAGNPWLKTPAMDYIADNGVRFTRAYCTNPVSSPSRTSLMTGRMACDFTTWQNERVHDNHTAGSIRTISDQVKNTSLGAWMQKTEYELVYGGKTHLPKPLMPNVQGFNILTGDERDDLVEKSAEFIRERRSDKPYMMIVSLINPHDICYMAIRDFPLTGAHKNVAKTGNKATRVLDKAVKTPEGVSTDEFYATLCPPLPGGYEIQKDEPKAIGSLLDKYGFRREARANYTDRQWRLHRWAYCRLTEYVDAQIQVVLDAIRESGQEENTIIIFSSDHGDMDATHRLEHKSVLYEPAANIPFMVMWKGHIAAGRVDNTHLVSNHLDLLPTVCDYAGINGKADPRGASLRPLLEQKKGEWRKTLGVDAEVGAMVVAEDGLKYCRYTLAGIEENQLLDLKADPYETRQFASDAKYARRLKELREEFETKWFPTNRINLSKTNE
ncbi:hypothetical protein FACS1894159_03630 [Bacteroidia bacterium]|nr:hypothetical protein FACS1894159_03630 [Bacteroidia bacterium]